VAFLTLGVVSGRRPPLFNPDPVTVPFIVDKRLSRTWEFVFDSWVFWFFGFFFWFWVFLCGFGWFALASPPPRFRRPFSTTSAPQGAFEFLLSAPASNEFCQVPFLPSLLVGSIHLCHFEHFRSTNFLGDPFGRGARQSRRASFKGFELGQPPPSPPTKSPPQISFPPGLPLHIRRKRLIL